MSNKKYKLVAIIGKSAVGKDTILDEVLKRYKGLNKKISTTTRPPRDYEKDGEDYYFVDGTTFAQKIVDFDMLEATNFRDWFYGTEKKGLKEDCINIGVFNPEGVESLIENDEIDLMVIWIISKDKTRLIRSLSREKSPDIEEIFRRYQADKEDFHDLSFNYYPVLNEENSDLDKISHDIGMAIIKHYTGQS